MSPGLRRTDRDVSGPGGYVEDTLTRRNAALDRRQEIEREAPRLIQPETYVEPFALRALGFAREDDELLRQAIDRFEAMSLVWHAAQTQRLLTGES
ncbi:MAG: hypothetical protein ACRDLU_00105 [Gaiellaceae bacterium]